jgi:hypothetical protein
MTCDHRCRTVEVSVKDKEKNVWFSVELCPECEKIAEIVREHKLGILDRQLADELLGVCSREDY